MSRWHSLVFFALFAMAPCLCKAEISGPLYPGQWTYAPIPTPDDVVATDLNGDGLQDIIVSGEEGTIELIGNGNGSFQPAIPISSEGGHLFVHDFNSDGIPDIVTVGNSGISIDLGKGGGNFYPTRIISAQPYPDGAVCDFNDDGNEDITVAGWGGFELYLGNGDGTFTLSPTAYTNSGADYALTAADFNDDGNCDIALINYAYDDVYLYLGNGDGTFKQPSVYPVGIDPLGIHHGDFNRDGYPDLIVENTNTYDISLLINNGDGTFQAQQRYRVGNSPMDGIFKDINGDGYADYMEFVYATGGPETFFGNSSGLLETPTPQYLGGSLGYPVLTDLNGDNKDDLVTAPFSNWISRYFGNGDGTFQGEESAKTSLFFPNALAYADFNNDGSLDLAAVGMGSGASNGNLVVSLNSGSGKFDPAKTFQTWGANVPAIHAGDVNKDGKQDIVTVENNVSPTQQSMLAVYLGNGDGTFQAPSTYPAGANDNQLLLADINHDGYLDAIVRDLGPSTTTSPPSIHVLLNKGDGSFVSSVTYSAPNSKYIALSDVNGDGNKDLVMLSFNQFSIMLGNGDGTFSSPNTFTITNSTTLDPSGLALHDLNNDGIPDIVISDATGSLYILLGNGDGTFQAPIIYKLHSQSPSNIAFSDVNQDGNVDIIVKDQDSFDVFLGDGSGHFPEQQRYAAAGYDALGVFDANGDGLPDVITMSQDPDANAYDYKDFYISLHLPPRLAFKNANYSAIGGETLSASAVAVDPSNLPITYSTITQPKYGKLSFQSNGNFDYSPNMGFTGIDTFRIRASDGSSSIESLALVNVVNPPSPTITNLSQTTIPVYVGSPVPPVTFTLSGTGPLTLSAKSSNTTMLPNTGISWNADCVTTDNCTLSLTPAANETGAATVTLTVSDSYSQSSSKSLDLQILQNSTGGGSGGGGGSSGGSSSGGNGGSGGGRSNLLVLLALMILWTLTRTCRIACKHKS